MTWNQAQHKAADIRRRKGIKHVKPYRSETEWWVRYKDILGRRVTVLG